MRCSRIIWISTLRRAARAYAYETIAQHDATLACWDTKYTYLELRPPQADPTIIPLFALPQHPGFPSGHACASGASAAMMSYLFPADQQALTSMASDAGNSTFDALIHTPFDVSQGLAHRQPGRIVDCQSRADRRRELIYYSWFVGQEAVLPHNTGHRKEQSLYDALF